MILISTSRPTHMPNPHKSPDSKQNKNRNNLLEMRFEKVKDQFEHQTYCDNKKVQCQEKLREKLSWSKRCTFGQILDQKNSFNLTWPEEVKRNRRAPKVVEYHAGLAAHQKIEEELFQRTHERIIMVMENKTSSVTCTSSHLWLLQAT